MGTVVKLKRAVALKSAEGVRQSSARYWFTADGRFRVCQPWDTDGKRWGYWEIRPVGVYDVQDQSEWERYQKESSFLAAYGLKQCFRRRRDALEALAHVLAGVAA